MMTPLAYDDDSLTVEAFTESEGIAAFRPQAPTASEVYLFSEKLAVPSLECVFERQRITDLLLRSLDHFNGTMISGRTRTGKTVAAAHVAQAYQQVAWYSLESTDIEWDLFSRYFRATVLRNDDQSPAMQHATPTDSPIAMSRFLYSVLDRDENQHQPRLIVFDDVHHIFDAPWFADFFKLLLCSVEPNTHLLFTCRSKPPLPLWRMRSKQLLNVIDEKVLALDQNETAKFLALAGSRPALAKKAQAHSFGRIGKIVDYLAAIPPE